MNESIKSSSTMITVFLVLTCVVVFFGLCGNMALFKAYFKKNRQIRFNILMMVLAVFDSMFLLNAIVLDAINYKKEIIWNDSYHLLLKRDKTLLTSYKIVEFSTLFSFGGSVFTALTIALERYLMVCRNK